MTTVSQSSPIKATYHIAKKTTQKGVEGMGYVVETTEGFKKIFQVAKGVLELIGSFTSVAVLSPVINAAKVIGITVGGFDIIGRIKEWVVPDKNGETLLHKHWTKIISRIHLTFANLIDTVKMFEFFHIFTLIKLGTLGALMSKVYFFKVIFDHFPGLDVIKHPFIAFSSAWGIFDSSLTINRKIQAQKHIKHKERNWERLALASYDRQLQFFETRIDRYTNRLEKYEDMKASNHAKLNKKLSKYDQKKLNRTMTVLPKYEKLVEDMKNDEQQSNADTVMQFANSKANKWHTKVKNIKIDFAKAGISIGCEVLKIFVVGTALILSLTMIGWAFLPAMLLVLGIVSNGASLSKFLVDKLVSNKSVPRVKLPKLAV